MRRVMLFDRYDQPIGELSEGEVFGLYRTERVNGEHTLTITTTRVLEKGWRVLTRDARGKWREHVVYGTDASHDAGDRPFGDYYCVWSIQADLMGTRVSSMPGVQTPVSAGVALARALEGTARWQVGTVTNTATGGASMYDMDGWSAMSVMIENWGGEIDVTIEVGSSGVTGRKVDYYSLQGDQQPKRRYDFGADIRSVRRRIADGPMYCRITPRGMGEETGEGYGRKITIESVNNGKDYLENSAMVDLAKLPDGGGGWEYPTIEVENSDCETPAALKAWALGVVDEYTVPKITYDIDVLQLAREGVDMHGVSLGDAIHVVDRKFGDGLRVSGRVLQMTTNLLDEYDVQLLVGSFAQDLASLVGSFDTRLAQVTNTVQAMNGGTMSTEEYLSRLLDRLNVEINALGGYTYITQGFGIRCYDAEVSDPTDGTAEASSVVEIKGGTIRIADSKTAQGEWEWKTVFTSGHILADLVTAAAITAGYIGSADSGNYWDLDTGEFRMATTSYLGGSTVQQVLDGVAATITSVDVEYAQNQSASTAPETGWSTTAPSHQTGYYIWSRTATTTPSGTTYSTPVMISGKDGTDGQNGSNGQDGANGQDGRGITSSAISYGTSASASTQPSSWSSTAPTSIAGGTWLWVRTVTTYSDNTDSTTYSKSYVGTDGQNGQDGTSVTILGSYNTLSDLQAAHPTGSVGDGYLVAGDLYVWNGTAWTDVGTIQGPQGQPGADGTSVTVSTIEYGTSASGSTQPSSWSTTPPSSISQGTWLWVKTTYSDGSSATTRSYVGTDGSDGTSVYVQSSTKSGGTTTVVLSDGTSTTTLAIDDGTDGTDGTPGTNGLNGYVHVAWATSADGSQGFSTSVSTGKTYIGVYTDNTSADSQTYSDYSWSLIKGADGTNGTDGADGADGVGITSIAEQYYLSTSDSTQTGGSWSDAQPAWESGKCIWTRSVITWDTTPATTTTTTPVLAQAINGANEEAASASAAVTALDNSLNQAEIFNRLTNNGALLGLYMYNGELYINASYIASGYISADRIRGGTLIAGGVNNADGSVIVYDAAGNAVATIDNTGTVLWHLTSIRNGSTNTNGVLVEASEIDTSSADFFEAVTGYIGSTTGSYRIPAFKVASTTTSKSTRRGNIYLVPRLSINSNYVNYYKSTVYSDAPLQLIGGIDLETTASDYPTLYLGPSYSGLMYGAPPQASTGTAYRTGISAYYILPSKVLMTGNSIEIQPSTAGSSRFVMNSSTLTIGYSSNVRINTTMYGNLSVSGTKSRLVETDGCGNRHLYAYETPTPYFGDLGSGAIGDDGLCYVEIDDVFAEAARADIAYQVFLQKCGQGDLWVEEKAQTHFVVAGTPGLKFDWELKCKQKGYEELRMEQPEFDPADMHEDTDEIGNPEDAYGDYGYIDEQERILYEAA